MKTFARAELSNVLTNTHIKTMIVYGRDAGGKKNEQTGQFDPPPKYKPVHPEDDKVMEEWYNIKDTAPTGTPQDPNVLVKGLPVNPMVFQRDTDSWDACYINTCLSKHLKITLAEWLNIVCDKTGLTSLHEFTGKTSDGKGKADSSVEEGTAAQSGDRKAITSS